MSWTEGDIERLKNKGLKINGLDTVQNSLQENNELFKKVKRKMRHDESDLQQRCVETFRLIYPKLKYNFFAVPNGSYRTAITAALLQKQGVLPGVSDVFLAVPNNNNQHGLFIEFKTETGKLSEYQVQFIKAVQSKNYSCVVVRNVEQFIAEIKNYLECKP